MLHMKSSILHVCKHICTYICILFTLRRLPKLQQNCSCGPASVSCLIHCYVLSGPFRGGQGQIFPDSKVKSGVSYIKNNPIYMVFHCALKKTLGLHNTGLVKARAISL